MHTFLLLATLLHAQQPASAPTGPLARARAATQLPALAERLRAAGVPAADVKEALDAGKTAGVEDTAQVLDGAAQAAEDGAPVPQLGRFVKARLDEGLRGKALADAIHEEHRRRKAERGEDGGAEDDKGDHEGKPDDKGKPEHDGKPDDKGKPEHDGKPDGKGKPEHRPEHGKPDGKGRPEHRTEHGRPDGKGKPEHRPEHGRPDGKGKPEHGGKHDDRKGGPR